MLHCRVIIDYGNNYLTSETPMWFAGPDLVASAIRTGKVPQIPTGLIP